MLIFCRVFDRSLGEICEVSSLTLLGLFIRGVAVFKFEHSYNDMLKMTALKSK